MIKKRIIAILFIFSIGALQASTTRVQRYQVNPEHSEISFEVNYMRLSSVSGRFQEYRGHFDKNSDTGKIENTYFEIQVESIDTVEQKRDQHLIGPDFFETSKYPTIIFEQTKPSAPIQAGQQFEIHGKLTIKDKTLPITFSLQYLGKQADQLNREAHFYRGETQIDRRDYNLNWNQLLDRGGWVVGDLVDIGLVIEAYTAQARSAFGRFFRPSQRRLESESRQESETVAVDSKKLSRLNQRVDELVEEVVFLRKENVSLKKENKQLKKRVDQSSESTSAMGLTQESLFYLILMLATLISLATYAIKSWRGHFIVNLNAPLFEEEMPLKLSGKKLFIAEWLMDTGIIYTIILILGLSALWLGVFS